MKVEKLKTDGVYPSDKGWRIMCHIPRELACTMLGVPHFGPDDRVFENRGYVVVSVTSSCAIAVYHKDGAFSIVESTEDGVIGEYRDRPNLVAPIHMIEADRRDVKCGECRVIHNKDKECPGCAVKKS